MTRRVVLICGPAGAGKTTYAHSLGMTVYDLDDPGWIPSSFNAALTILGRAPDAQAAVIRSGATQSARAKAAEQIRATETVILTVDADECIRRVIARGRQVPPVHHQIAAVRTWWASYEPDLATDIGQMSEAW